MFSLNLAAALAWADDVAAAQQQQANWFSPLILFGAMFLFMYLFMIRPQQKKQKEHQEMLNSLQKGDRILIGGGIFGHITGVGGDQNELTVEIAPQVRVKVNRAQAVRLSPRPGPESRDKK